MFNYEFIQAVTFIDIDIGADWLIDTRKDRGYTKVQMLILQT